MEGLLEKISDISKLNKTPEEKMDILYKDLTMNGVDGQTIIKIMNVFINHEVGNQVVNKMYKYLLDIERRIEKGESED